MEDENKKSNRGLGDLFGGVENTAEVIREITHGVVDQKNFCEKEFFDAEIMPLLKTIAEKCADREIPLLVSVAHSNDDKKCGIVTVGGFPGARTPLVFRSVLELLKNEDAFMAYLMFKAIGKMCEK